MLTKEQKKAVLAEIRKNPFGFSVADEELDEELCLAAVKINGRMLGCVPERLRTREMCEAAVEKDGGALEFIPDGMILSEETYRAAVLDDGFSIRWLPKSVMLSEEDVREIVRRCWQNFWQVPERMRSVEVCAEALRQARKEVGETEWPELREYMLEDIPQAIETQVLAAVRRGGGE